MDNQHSSDFIQTLVEDVLAEFQLSKKQILAIVTDNASNMISAVGKLNEDCRVNLDDDIDTKSENAVELDKQLESTLTDCVEFSAISHMWCVVHTLQLAICDGLNVRHVHALSKI